MFLIEGERGCHRSCTFCVMRRSTNGGMRLVTPERILSFIPEHAKRVGLVGAAISDHPKLPQLFEKIVSSGREVGIKFPTSRPNCTKTRYFKIVKRRRIQYFTVASDAASHRLRKTISKGTLEKHIVECAKQSAEHKYKVLKVYMMLGLPDEQDEDIDELIKFTLDQLKFIQSHWV